MSAIFWIWLIGLVGAAIWVVFLLKQAILLVRSLGEIRHLAIISRDAARRIADHIAQASSLEELEERTGAFVHAARRAASVAASFEERLGARPGEPLERSP